MAGSSSAVVPTQVSSESEEQARILKKTLIPRTVYRSHCVAVESLWSRGVAVVSPKSLCRLGVAAEPLWSR